MSSSDTCGPEGKLELAGAGGGVVVAHGTPGSMCVYVCVHLCVLCTECSLSCPHGHEADAEALKQSKWTPVLNQVSSGQKQTQGTCSFLFQSSKLGGRPTGS